MTNTENTQKTHACDCIERKAVIRWVKTECNPYGKPTLDFESGKKVIEHLKQMPSAQPEIVRCKDCRYYQDNNGGYPHMNCKWDANETPDADDFCSGAERRTDE